MQEEDGLPARGWAGAGGLDADVPEGLRLIGKGGGGPRGSRKPGMKGASRAFPRGAARHVKYSKEEAKSQSP